MRAANKYPRWACAQRALGALIFIGTLFVLSPGARAGVTFDTDNLKILIDGLDAGATFNGTPFGAVVRSSDGAAEFTFHGDLDLVGQSVTFVGSRAASLIVEDNANLAFARFNLSASGATAGGAGGGTGGTGGTGGNGGNRGFGSTGDWITSEGGGKGGFGGDGGDNGDDQSHDGGDGASGSKAHNGKSGGAGGNGSAGTSGTSGFANPSSGGAGTSGGTAGAGGNYGYGPQGPYYGGEGGDYSDGVGDNGKPGTDGSDGNAGKSGDAGANGVNAKAGSNAASGLDTLAAGGGGGGGGAGGSGGGGGGGAVEIIANGRIVATGARLAAAGGNGSTGQSGSSGATGTPGSAGMAGEDNNDGGGAGGDGGDGGNGGHGGKGGNGGIGGGGAGGTIKLAGSVVITEPGTSTDVGGGTGSQDGDDGRLVFATNTTKGYEGMLDGRLETYQGLTLTGLGEVNPHIKDDLGSGIMTPYIPDLQGGAAVTGLLDGIDAQAAEFQMIFDNAPSTAMAALYRMDTGPTGYNHDFIGHDMLLLLNLRSESLIDPVFGCDAAGLDALFASGLISQGSIVTSLNGYDIYATLIPETIGQFNLGASGGQFISGETLTDGDYFYLTRVVPVPGALLLGSMGLGLGSWLCRRSSKRKAKA